MTSLRAGCRVQGQTRSVGIAPAGRKRLGVAVATGRIGKEPEVTRRKAAEVVEAALREGGIKADCLDLFLHIKIDLPTAQLATASAALVEFKVI